MGVLGRFVDSKLTKWGPNNSFKHCLGVALQPEGVPTDWCEVELNLNESLKKWVQFRLFWYYDLHESSRSLLSTRQISQRVQTLMVALLDLPQQASAHRNTVKHYRWDTLKDNQYPVAQTIFVVGKLCCDSEILQTQFGQCRQVNNNMCCIEHNDHIGHWYCIWFFSHQQHPFNPIWSSSSSSSWWSSS